MFLPSITTVVYLSHEMCFIQKIVHDVPIGITSALFEAVENRRNVLMKGVFPLADL